MDNQASDNDRERLLELCEATGDPDVFVEALRLYEQPDGAV
ncbi:MAG TPA: hypothetical protein VFA46_21375 [Actinomycetes bacterium]|nr:hypothetical protein [Actinomycetes bacterium]